MSYLRGWWSPPQGQRTPPVRCGSGSPQSDQSRGSSWILAVRPKWKNLKTTKTTTTTTTHQLPDRRFCFRLNEKCLLNTLRHISAQTGCLLNKIQQNRKEKNDFFVLLYQNQNMFSSWKNKPQTLFHFPETMWSQPADFIHFKGRLGNIFFLKNKIQTYKSDAALSPLLSLYTCGSDCVCRAPPSAWTLMFWFSPDVSGWGVGVFPLASEGAQVRLGVNKI